MDISEVFKLYPDNEPNSKGCNFFTLIDVEGVICYSTSYYNDDCKFESKFGKVVAFAEIHPSKILKELYKS